MAKSISLRLKVEEVKDTVEVGNNGFKKREVICLEEGEYPQHYKIEFIKDKTELPDSLIAGTYATFKCNIQGRKVESTVQGKDDMYFLSLQCWSIDVA